METVHDIYVNELIYGIFKDESRERLVSVINKLKNEKKVESIILGGTELPLILRQELVPDIKIYDTTEIHVNSIIEMALG